MAATREPPRHGPGNTVERFNTNIDTLPIELLDQIMGHCVYHYWSDLDEQSYGSLPSWPSLHHCALVSRTFGAAAQRALWGRLEFSTDRSRLFADHWYSQPDFVRSRYPPTSLFVGGMDILSTVLAGFTVPTIRRLVLAGYPAVHWNLITHPSLAAVTSLSIGCAIEPVNDNGLAWVGEPPAIPFSLRKLEIVHEDHQRPMSETLLTALLASPDLTTLALTSGRHGRYNVRPEGMTTFLAVFPLVASKLKRLDLDSAAPMRQLFPLLHLCTSVEHLTFRPDLTYVGSMDLVRDFYDAFPPANVIRRLDMHPLDPVGSSGPGYGLDVLTRECFPLLEMVVILHEDPEEIALATSTEWLVHSFGGQAGVPILDRNHVQIVPKSRAAVPRPPSPEPEPDTGLLSLVRRVWPVWGVEESKLSTVIEFVRFELEICFPGVVGSIVRFGITSALYFSGYAQY